MKNKTFIKISETTYMEMEKARPTKYIKRLPHPSGKGYIYFYTNDQITAYKKHGIIPGEEKKKGLFSGIMSFFKLKTEKQAEERAKKDYVESNVKERLQLTFSEWVDHLNEYLRNKERWDALILKKLQAQKDVQKTTPGSTERKKELSKEAMAEKNVSSQAKKNGFNFKVMYHIFNFYKKQEAKEEHETIQDTRDDANIRQYPISAVDDSVHPGGTEGRSLSNVPEREPSDNAGINGVTGVLPGERSGRDVRLTKTQIKATRQAILDLLASKTDEEMTEEDKALLRQYEGAGGLDEKDKSVHGTLYEYYTPRNVVSKMWSLVEKYAGTGRKEVLEPSAGIGRFAENKDHDFTMFELDETSARINSILFPEADISNKAFQEMFMKGGIAQKEYKGKKFQIVIGNPPYGEYSGFHKGLGEGKHHTTYQEYFIERGLDALEDGGIMAYIVPSGFLRGNKYSEAKSAISKKGRLLEAYRLPNGTFSTTGVGTDIIVIRKEQGSINDFLDDQYFKKNPDKILGEQTTVTGRFGPEQFVKLKPGDSFDNVINNIDINAVPVVAKGAAPQKEQVLQKTKINIEKKSKAEKQKADSKDNFETMPDVETETIESFNRKYNKKFNEEELGIWKATNADGFIEVGKLSAKDKKYLETSDNICVENNKYIHKTNYASGDIYKKLAILEQNKDNLSGAKYEQQKKILTEALPEYKTVSNFSISPISDFAKNFKFIGDVEEGSDGKSIVDRFMDWAYGGTRHYAMNWDGGVSRHDIPSGISWTDILDYISQKPVSADKRADQEDKDFSRAKKVELRRDVAEKLFKRFMETGLTINEQKELEDRYNRQFNAYVAPDYSAIPIFMEGMSSKFKGKDLIVKEKQMQGVSFLCNKGNGLLAYDVGVGKGHLLTSDILTPDGWVKMGNISINDLVIGKNGKPITVTGVYPLGKVQCYRVTFSDGSYADVSDEHLWNVQTINYRSKYPEKWDTVKTKDIKDKLYNSRGDFQFSIPMVEPVQFNKKELKINPYLMGILLGDGGISSRNVVISSADKFIIDEIKPLLPEGIGIKKKPSSQYDYACFSTRKRDILGRFFSDNPLNNALREYGLLGKKSEDKFIPDVYKYNAVEDRIALLQGLMDSDGYVNQKGTTIQFTSVSERLINDITEIVQSLGGTVRLTQKKPSFSYNQEKKQGQLAYTLSIRLKGDIQPFRLPRKKDKVKNKTKYLPIRFIESIEDIGFHEAQCIKVNAKDSLYVCEDYLVTHNTMTGIIATVNQMQTGRAKKPVICVPKAVYKNWIKEIRDLFPNIKINDLGNLGTQFAKNAANIEEGSLSVMTYEALGNITFKEETIQGGLVEDMLDSQQMTGEGMSDRERAEMKEKIMEKLGNAVKSKSIAVSAEDREQGWNILKIVNKEGLKRYGGREISPASIKEAYKVFGEEIMLIKEGASWSTIHKKTGLQIQQATTKDGVIEATKKVLSRQGEEGFTNAIKNSVESKGIINSEDNFETMPEDDNTVKSGSFFLEDLGFDHITVDEVHNFKNIFGQAKPQKQVGRDGKEKQTANEFQGLTGSSSDRGMKMFALTQVIQQQNNDRNIFALSATPFTNSPLEIYNILSLVARKRLKELGIYNLHEFMAQFAKLKSEWAIKSDGKIERKSVMKEFQNLSALQSLIREYIDKIDGEEAGVIRPNKNTQLVQIEMSEIQKKMYQIEMERFDQKDSSGRPYPGATLKAINNMRMITVSPHLIKMDDDELYQDSGLKEMVQKEDMIEDSPKLKFIFDCAANFYESNKEKGQVIYMPRGTKQYNKMVDNLVGKGVPKKAIATIDSSTAPDKKEAIMASFNDPNGDIKIIIGSETIKEGVNLNGNSAILYNALLGWNPSETTQVEGRIWRQGNKQGQVHIVYPQLVDSVDAAMYQKHDEKSERFKALWSFKGDMLNVEDINPEELKFEIIKDPEKRAKFQMDLKTEELDNQVREKRIFIDTLNKYQSDLSNEKYKLEAAKKQLPAYESDVADAEKELEEIEKELKEYKATANKKDDPAKYEIEISRFDRMIRGAKDKIQSEKRYVREEEKKIKFAEQNIEGILSRLNGMGISENNIGGRMATEEATIVEIEEQIKKIKDSKQEFIDQARVEIAASRKSVPPLEKTIKDSLDLIKGNLQPMEEVLKEMKKALKIVFKKIFNAQKGKYQYYRM